MKFKSTVSVLCVTGLLAAALTGCGSSASAGSTGSAAASAAVSTSASVGELSEGSTITGRVQQITGDSLTLLVGGGPDGQGSGGGSGGNDRQGGSEAPSGQAPGAGNSSSQNTSDQQPAQPPQAGNGSAAASSSEAAQPGKGPSGQNAPASGGAAVTIKLNDSTVIKVQGTSGESDGTTDDITEGAMVTVTMGADTAAATVVVENASAPGGDAGPDASQSQASSSGSPANAAS